MGGDPRADDLVELGGRRFLPPGWRPSRGSGALALAALIAGLAAGYAAGDGHARGSAAPPEPAGTGIPSATPKPPTATPKPTVPAPAASFSFAGSPALTQDVAACAAQTGRELELGVRVTNQSAAPLTLRTVRAVLPLGGLRQVAEHWAPCGTLPAGLIAASDTLKPGASTWLTVTFKVMVRCPGPDPVQFAVGYRTKGHRATARLPGFTDLDQVSYTGCRAHA